VDIAGQKPATVALLAIYRHAMPGRAVPPSRLHAGSLTVSPGSDVGDLADNNDLFQLAGATDPHLSVGGHESWTKIPPGRTALGPG